MPSKSHKVSRVSATLAGQTDATTTRGDCSADLATFWETWEQCREAFLRQYCLKWMAGSLEDAEDALSSACLKALQSYMEHEQTIRNLKAWLIRLVYHHCMDLHRRHKRYRRAASPGSHACWTWTEERASDTNSPEYLALLHELQCHVRFALVHLPDGLQTPVCLRYWDNLAHNDIAVHLNLSACNARKRLQIACTQLRRLLHAYYTEDAVMPFPLSGSGFETTAQPGKTGVEYS